jgi:hypothetical protein
MVQALHLGLLSECAFFSIVFGSKMPAKAGQRIGSLLSGT